VNRRRLPVAVVLLLAAAALNADNPITIGEGMVVPPRVFPSQIMGEDRAIYVSLPVSYAVTKRSYPVLYLTDAAEKFMHTQATTAFLSRNGLIPEMIVVAVGNTDRPRDLTPTNDPARPTSGHADRFLDFFEKELIPFVEANYRTAPFRVFAGHSLGGLFALHSMRAKPGLFQAVVAVSPSLMWDGHKELALLKPFLASDAMKTRILFYASGNEGPAMKEGVDSLTKALKAEKPKNLRFSSAYFPEENHGSVVLLSHYAALRMIFEGWAMPVEASLKRNAGALGDVEAYYTKLSERFGFPISPPEATVSEFGYEALDRKDIAAALDLFRFNVATYPESPVVYDSLGTALETKGDLPEALESYLKAEEVGRKTGEPRTAIFHADVERVRSEMGKGASAK
jgi:uncharacterized protein